MHLDPLDFLSLFADAFALSSPACQWLGGTATGTVGDDGRHVQADPRQRQC